VFDDFIVRAAIAGIGAAIVAGPFGCLIVWRRLSYFGDTLAHSALLGVALGLLVNIDLTVAVFLVAVLVALLLAGLQSRTDIPSDALLGLLSHGGLALGLVALALAQPVRVDLAGMLFGDILAVSTWDIAIIYGGGALLLLVLAVLWTRLFSATVSEEIAAAEGLRPEWSRLAFILALACFVAIAMKIVGILLITALLIIPAAAARRLSTGPEQMAALATLIGVLSVILGLFGSLKWDTPSGPSVIVAALILFVAAMVAPRHRFVRSRNERQTE
jgi:zinc transport system permease protein